jgi:hypothetical protein
LARSLRHLPVCEQGWLAGDVGAAHVGVIAGVRRPATQARLAEDEPQLVGYAKQFRFAGFVRLVRYWEQHADPDGADGAAGDDRAARRVQLSRSVGGMWFGDMVLDPVGGNIVGRELARREKAMFEADWADARRRLGREPSAADLARSPGQRRADALVEMAVDARSAPAGGLRPAPLFTVLVGWETFCGRICQLADGTVVAPAALKPWLDTAWVERVVFDGPSRVLDVGVRRRLYAGATRRAVEVRDQHCTHPYCDTPADGCDIDHIVAYQDGGLTTQTNGRLVCPAHHRARHTHPEPDP